MMGVFPHFSHSFPLGLGGLFGAAEPTETFATVEDRVRKLLDETRDGELALIYKMLHNLGYRRDNVDARIDALRKTLK